MTKSGVVSHYHEPLILDLNAAFTVKVMVKSNFSSCYFSVFFLYVSNNWTMCMEKVLIHMEIDWKPFVTADCWYLQKTVLKLGM